MTPSSSATLTDPALEPVEKITFQFGPFKLAGELQLPGEGEGYPVVVMVHGDGPIDRDCYGLYQPLMARFLQAGYAVFSWDKPGTGESAGQLSDSANKLDQRASILVSAIETLKRHPAVDGERIGTWGHSQAGYVIPLALRKTDDIDFVVMVSGPGMDSFDQGAYLTGQMAFCAGASQEEARRIEGYLPTIYHTNNYQAYEDATTNLLDHPYYYNLDVSISIRSEEQWSPMDRDDLAFFNPIEVIENTNLPILAVFGEKDRQADPLQGVKAYQEAMGKNGVAVSQAVLLPNVDHNIVFSETGCLEERDNYSFDDWLDYSIEYLDLLEAWLSQVDELEGE
jgi:hypothetical protein